jgi:hypothetical protein
LLREYQLFDDYLNWFSRDVESGLFTLDTVIDSAAMKMTRAVRGWALLLLGSTALAAQKVLSVSKHNPLDADFELFAIQTLQEWHVPGLAIAIIDGNDTWAAVSHRYDLPCGSLLDRGGS